MLHFATILMTASALLLNEVVPSQASYAGKQSLLISTYLGTYLLAFSSVHVLIYPIYVKMSQPLIKHMSTNFLNFGTKSCQSLFLF